MKPGLRRFLYLLFFVVLVFSAASCKKKSPRVSTSPPPARDTTPETEPVRPAPTIQLSADPSTIQRGEETTLTWSAANSDAVVIDGGVGTVAASGSVKVSPLESTTYTAVASGGGRDVRSSARVTVVRPAPSTDIEETDIQALRRLINEGKISPVFFDYDSAELTTDARRVLEENAKWFREYPGVRIIVEGHCDERGTEEYNLALGDRRATAARDYLVQLGIRENLLDAVSYGEERPFVQGSNESAWAKNRRAHFTIP
jgi:peptidoglycan-associated lipoprotein